MNITFITPSFKLGGYERVVVNYANAFSKLDHNISILCGFEYGELLCQVNKNVHIVCLNARIRSFIFPLIKYLNNNKIDILYTPFETYTSVAIIARHFSNNDFVIYGSSHGYDEGSKLSNCIYGKILKRADILTGVTKDLCEFDSKKFNIPINKYYVFNNPVINSEIPVIKEFHNWFKDKEYPIICMAGRLDENKNYYLALDIIKEVIKLKKIRLMIIGNGNELEKLKRKVNILEITEYVDFIGYVDNPLGYIKQCDIFLHTAKIESFGNVIVEALFCEKPIISTNCKGPEEILNNGQYGVLIGKYDDVDVVKNGVSAICNILDGKIKFKNQRKKALEYDAKYLEKDFIQYVDIVNRS